uniref:Putative secreted protein n=1 Tax=Rhipicephalus microplus TaxID=6941 RepID=A0A6M2DB16_RHIMP
MFCFFFFFFYFSLLISHHNPVKVQFVSQQVSEQKKSEKLCMHMRTNLQTFLCPAKERKRQAKCKRILLFPDFKAMFKR